MSNKELIEKARHESTDGLPLANQANPEDAGVAVYFTDWRNGKQHQRVLACDKWAKVEHNIRALQLSVEAMRGLDRWGASQILDRAFTGFEQLPPPPKAESKRPWWEVLNLSHEVRDLGAIKALRRAYAQKFHPDNGATPNAARMAEVNAACDEGERLCTR